MEPGFTSSSGHPERAIWVDTRIWRIAEVLLHSAALYKALGIAPDEPYMLAVDHRGLIGREFYTSDPRRFVLRGRFCKVPNTSWTREVTQDLVDADIKALVHDVASQLFVLFDFADVAKSATDEIVEEFSRRRF